MQKKKLSKRDFILRKKDLAQGTAKADYGKYASVLSQDKYVTMYDSTRKSEKARTRHNVKRKEKDYLHADKAFIPCKAASKGLSARELSLQTGMPVELCADILFKKK